MPVRGQLTATTDVVRRSLYRWLKEQEAGEMPPAAQLARVIGAPDAESVCHAFGVLQKQGLIALRGGGRAARGHRLVFVHVTRAMLKTPGCPFESLDGRT